ncbi:MAG: PAS-domain containing protein [Pseudomonadota bacterium]
MPLSPTATPSPSPAPVAAAFAALLDGLSDGVLVFGPDRRLKAFNASFCRHFGLDAGAIAPGDTLERVLRTVAARGGLDCTSSVEEAVRLRLAIWGSEQDRRERRYLADGRVFDILRSRTPEGDIMSVHVDVTEALARERSLELQRVYMESILENIEDGVALVDGDGTYIAFNTRFLEHFRVDPAKVRWGMHFEELYLLFGDLDTLEGPAREAALAQRRRFITDPKRTLVERRLHDGRTIRVLKSLLPAGGCVLTTRDITEELRRTEALERAQDTAEQASRYKSQFLARMSHEMRTPLNGVLGIAALLRQTDLDPRQRELVEVITGSGTMLVRLIDDVLDLARVEAGSVALVEQAFDLVAVLRECLGLIAPVARAKGLTIEPLAAPERVPLVLGDPVRLKQVLINLLGNAVKFTETGKVSAALDVALALPDTQSDQPPEPGGRHCYCCIRISDTGIGIPKAKREEIFHQFYQIERSDKVFLDGSGLGLAITRTLLDAMGGTIAVVDVAGAATTFEIRLRLALAHGRRDRE